MDERVKIEMIEFLRLVTALTKDYIEGETNCDKMDKFMTIKIPDFDPAFEPLNLLRMDIRTKRDKNVPCAELLQKAVRDSNLIYRLTFGLPEPANFATIPWQVCPMCHGEANINPVGTSSVAFRSCPVCGGTRKIPMYVAPL